MTWNSKKLLLHLLYHLYFIIFILSNYSNLFSWLLFGELHPRTPVQESMLERTPGPNASGSAKFASSCMGQRGGNVSRWSLRDKNINRYILYDRSGSSGYSPCNFGPHGTGETGRKHAIRVHVVRRVGGGGCWFLLVLVVAKKALHSRREALLDGFGLCGLESW